MEEKTVGREEGTPAVETRQAQGGVRPLLEVRDLKVSYNTYAGRVQSVRGVSFDVPVGGTVAIVGESGCGKSVTAKAVMGLIKKPGEVDPGSRIMFEGKNILDMAPEELRAYKGGSASLVFQEALEALDPTMRVGKQICETLLSHGMASKKEAQERAVELLREMGIPEPERRFRQFPHELSGGMRQRVMIATAVACVPKLLVCDEPTTALDVTIQDQILTKIRDIRDAQGTAVIMITHDMGIVASIAHDIVVMYAGLVMERGTVRQVFARQRHPYTYSLLRSLPQVNQGRSTRLASIEGNPPDLINPPKGCPFASRCQFSMPICHEAMPQETEFECGHKASCWLHHDMAPHVNDTIQEGAAS